MLAFIKRVRARTVCGRDLQAKRHRVMLVENSLIPLAEASAVSPVIPSVLQGVSFGVAIVDASQPDHPIISVNTAYCALTGYQPHEIIGRNCRFLQGPETNPDTISEIAQALSLGIPIRREILNYTKAGATFWNDLYIDPIHDHEGAVIGFIGISYDITLLHLAREQQNEVQLRLDSIMSHLPGYVFSRVMARSGQRDLTYCSPSISEFLGLGDLRNVTGEVFNQHIYPEDRARMDMALAQSAHNMSPYHAEYRLRAHDGSLRWFRCAAQPRRLENEDVVWDGLALDITEEKSAQAELDFLVCFDPLTGLANRAQFRSDSIELISAKRHEVGHIAMLVINLSAFQDVNDTHGPLYGDRVLAQIGGRIETFARDVDGITGRLGGDEFVLMLTGVPQRDKVIALAQRLESSLSQPLQVGGMELAVNLYVGATLFPDPARPANAVADERSNATIYDDMMKQADLALRSAKQIGPGTTKLFEEDVDTQLLHRMTLRQSLRRAVDEKQFVLHYQPMVDLSSGRIVGAEALVRWNHPVLGFQRPDIFIPLAEETGAIEPLGAWIMQEAMRQQQDWTHSGLNVPSVAINISSVELGRPGFVMAVQRALELTGANPAYFELELTEGRLTTASPEVLAVMEILRRMGFRLVLDDFGTGYATFGYLRDFPLNKIKIDQSFIKSLGTGSKDLFMVRSIIALSRDLGLDVVAEGIETITQRNLLVAEGCRFGQGYLFSQPLPPEGYRRLQMDGCIIPPIS